MYLIHAYLENASRQMLALLKNKVAGGWAGMTVSIMACWGYAGGLCGGPGGRLEDGISNHGWGQIYCSINCSLLLQCSADVTAAKSDLCLSCLQ